MRIDAGKFLDDQLDAVLRRAGVEDVVATRAVVSELWGMRATATVPRMLELPAAEELGAMVAEAGEGPSEAVRLVLALGQALAESAVVTGVLDLEGVARLRQITGEAAARAADGHGRFFEERREGWLSYLSHQMKNPINTVLNALWLLKEHGPAAGSERFLELAERAVKKIEQELAEVRQLNRKVREAPPERLTARAPAGGPPHS